MAEDLTTLVDPESVRKLCRHDLTASKLPDQTVRREVFIVPAVAELLQLDPKAAEREGSAAQHVVSALNHLVAARVLPALSLPEKEDFGDGGGFTRTKQDVQKRVAELKALASEEISFVLAPEVAQRPGKGIPTFFTLGKGGRGR